MASVAEIIAQLNVCKEKIDQAAAMLNYADREMEELAQQYAGILSSLPGGDRFAGIVAAISLDLEQLKSKLAALDEANNAAITTQQGTGA
jgi:chromosome segregation ATPase